MGEGGTCKYFIRDQSQDFFFVMLIGGLIVIHLLLAPSVQYRNVFFAALFCTGTILHFWVTTCQGTV